LQQVQEEVMADYKERRKTPRKAAQKPDVNAAAPRKSTSEQRSAPLESNVRSARAPEDMRKQIEEAAYYRAKQRGFAPGHELEDWVQAESEVMQRNGLR
jgi:hypothetical protein